MSAAYQMTVEDTPATDDLALVQAGLDAFNQRHAPDGSFTPLAVLLRDAHGQAVGGLLGGTYWGWLVIDRLWLPDVLRGQGWGSRMLHAAEHAAIVRGCHGAHLDTMSFQAPEFYQRHGYHVFGVINDLPHGHQRIFLKKLFAPTPTGSETA